MEDRQRGIRRKKDALKIIYITKRGTIFYWRMEATARRQRTVTNFVTGRGVGIIKAFLLCIAFSKKSGLISLNGSISPAFDLSDPANRSFSWR